MAKNHSADVCHEHRNTQTPATLSQKHELFFGPTLPAPHLMLIRSFFCRVSFIIPLWRKSVSKSFTKRVTEKMQVTTGQSVVCQCCTSGLPQYYMHDSPLACTEYNLPTKRGFDPITDVTITLMVYRVLEQRCREWNVPLYISTIDFTKAFDRIKHSAIWSSLQFYGTKPAYVRLLQRLYSRQERTVLTGKESDTFPIKRATKQGYPLSSLMFNTVLQYSLEGDLKRWQEKKKASG